MDYIFILFSNFLHNNLSGLVNPFFGLPVDHSSKIRTAFCYDYISFLFETCGKKDDGAFRKLKSNKRNHNKKNKISIPCLRTDSGEESIHSALNVLHFSSS